MDKTLPEFRVIIGATVVFVSGLIIFFVIFRALLFLNQLQSIYGPNTSQIEVITNLMQWIPWGLGAIYFALVTVVIYFVIKGRKLI